MNRNTAFWGTIAGIGAGAAAMYFLDPDRGARRRALVRDKVNSKALKASRAITAKKNDLANRGYGMMMEAKNLLDLPAMGTEEESRTSQAGGEVDAENEARSHRPSH